MGEGSILFSFPWKLLCCWCQLKLISDKYAPSIFYTKVYLLFIWNSNWTRCPIFYQATLLGDDKFVSLSLQALDFVPIISFILTCPSLNLSFLPGSTIISLRDHLPLSSELFKHIQQFYMRPCHIHLFYCLKLLFKPFVCLLFVAYTWF